MEEGVLRRREFGCLVEELINMVEDMIATVALPASVVAKLRALRACCEDVRDAWERELEMRRMDGV